MGCTDTQLNAAAVPDLRSLPEFWVANRMAAVALQSRGQNVAAEPATGSRPATRYTSPAHLCRKRMRHWQPPDALPASQSGSGSCQALGYTSSGSINCRSRAASGLDSASPQHSINEVYYYETDPGNHPGKCINCKFRNRWLSSTRRWPWSRYIRLFPDDQFSGIEWQNLSGEDAKGTVLFR